MIMMIVRGGGKDLNACLPVLERSVVNEVAQFPETAVFFVPQKMPPRKGHAESRSQEVTEKVTFCRVWHAGMKVS